MTLSATPSKILMYSGNTQAIEVQGLQDAISLSYLDAATVTATLVDDDGNQILGCIGVTLNYQAGTNGNYTGIFGDVNFQPPEGTGYTLLVDANESGSYGHWDFLVEIVARHN